MQLCGRGYLVKAGIATIALRRYDIFQALDLAAEAGFRGVEIWGKPSHMPEEFDKEHTLRVRDRTRANGLEVIMFGSYVRPMLPDFDQKAAESIKIAKILGARIIRIWAGNKEPHEADDEIWSFVASQLHEFALRAEDDGITLAMEMHSGTLCATPEGALRVIEQTNSPNLKINFQVVDPSSPDLERTIAMVGRYVVNVHAQNYRRSPLDPEKIELCLLEEGMVDYDKVLSLLAEQGFNRFVEVEFLKGEHVSEEAMLDSLRKDAAYLQKLVDRYTATA